VKRGAMPTLAIVDKVFLVASMWRVIATWVSTSTLEFIGILSFPMVGPRIWHRKKKVCLLFSSGFKKSYMNNSLRVDFEKILLASYISTLFILVALHFLLQLEQKSTLLPNYS
jgi:hypothetical protein